MRTLLVSLLCILCPFLATGQGTNAERPDWVNGYYLDKPNSYIEVVSATGYSSELAREAAIEQIIANRSRATGQRVSVSEVNGNISVTAQDELTVKCRILSEYVERLGAGEYRVSLLVQTAKNPTLTYEPVTISDKYAPSARAFVPGLAQIYKGDTRKGTMFIAGEALAIGGVVACEMLRQSYVAKISQTNNASAVNKYINTSNNMQNLRNGFIAGAAAIYLWNVIDGFVAKGVQHIEVGDVQLAAVPIASPQMTGMMLTMNF